MSEQHFVYQEDVKIGKPNLVLMVQEGGHPLSVFDLEDLSWDAPSAGRFTTTAEKLMATAKGHSRTLKLIERRFGVEDVPFEWSHLPLVRGASEQ